MRHAAPDGGAVVVGNSLGGCVALRLAERDELGLAGVVPVAPAGLDMARWLAHHRARPDRRRAPLAAPSRSRSPCSGGGRRGLQARRVPPAAARSTRRRSDAFTSHFADPRDVARYLATGRSLLPELKDPFQLERIACPVLVVWGEQRPDGLSRRARSASSTRCRARGSSCSTTAATARRSSARSGSPSSCSTSRRSRWRTPPNRSDPLPDAAFGRQPGRLGRERLGPDGRWGRRGPEQDAVVDHRRGAPAHRAPVPRARPPAAAAPRAGAAGAAAGRARQLLRPAQGLLDRRAPARARLPDLPRGLRRRSRSTTATSASSTGSTT